MLENISKAQAFKLKGRFYTLTVLHLLHPDKDVFLKQCVETVSKAPHFFEKTPVVFDVSALHHVDIDLQGLCQIARDHGMVPVAIQGGNALQDTLAQCQGLGVFNASKTIHEPVVTESVIAEALKSKVITAPVRSGQQVVAKGTDLIVTSAVSHGAELLADGNIHVYGALRGRALAGISGDLDARIYCQALEAELVSIAGFYRLSDAIGSVNGPCQIYLSNEHIVIEPL